MVDVDTIEAVCGASHVDGVSWTISRGRVGGEEARGEDQSVARNMALWENMTSFLF